MKINSVAVIGVGAVGCLYSARLSQYLGKEHVQILATGERLRRYKKEGFFLNGEKVDFNYVDAQKATEADLVILATKNLQLEEAIDTIKQCVGENTTIMSLLNGTESEEALQKTYGEKKVLYSFAVGLSSKHEGNRIQFDSSGRIVFGEKDNRKTERILAIETLFNNSGITCNVPADIRLELWKKFMLNTSFNTLSAITSSHYGDFGNESIQTLVRMSSQEVIAVANAQGIALTEQMVEDNLKTILSLNSEGMTSMFQDMAASRKTENDWFCGTVVKLGKRYHIDTPVCQILSLLVKSCEASRQRALERR